MKNKGLIVGLILAVFVIGVYVVMNISYGNTEVRLKNQLTAQQKANEAVYDNTWKIISQQAQIADQYKDAFREIYPELMEGRYGNARGGSLLSFVTESNPDFDTKLYDKVASSVETQRAIFTREQKKLIDLKREHDDLRQTFPGSFFVGDRPEFEIVVVTSSKTEQTFGTGKEDDVDLFNKQ